MWSGVKMKASCDNSEFSWMRADNTSQATLLLLIDFLKKINQFNCQQKPIKYDQ